MVSRQKGTLQPIHTLAQLHRPQPEFLLSLTAFHFHQTQRVVSAKIRAAHGRHVRARTVEYTRTSGEPIGPDLAGRVVVALDVFAHVVVAVDAVFRRFARFEGFFCDNYPTVYALNALCAVNVERNLNLKSRNDDERDAVEPTPPGVYEINLFINKFIKKIYSLNRPV